MSVFCFVLQLGSTQNFDKRLSFYSVIVPFYHRCIWQNYELGIIHVSESVNIKMPKVTIWWRRHQAKNHSGYLDRFEKHLKVTEKKGIRVATSSALIGKDGTLIKVKPFL